VDTVPGAWWFHRWEWLDYSLAYTRGSIDRSTATLDRNHRLCGVSPAIDEGGVIRMGGDPCVGPVGFSEGSPQRFAWRWTQPRYDSKRIIKSLEETPGVERTEWETVVQPLHGRSLDDRWHDIRKSYRTIIRRSQEEYSIRVGGVERWWQYVQCHRAAATRPRSLESYQHQWAMIKNGHGRIAVAVDDHGTCVAAVMALVYRGRAYYASGPSVRRGVQHGVLWAMSKHLADEGVGEFEIGWTGQPGGSESVEFFKRGFGCTREKVVVLSRD
jgi:hypothetical protein